MGNAKTKGLMFMYFLFNVIVNVLMLKYLMNLTFRTEVIIGTSIAIIMFLLSQSLVGEGLMKLLFRAEKLKSMDNQKRISLIIESIASDDAYRNDYINIKDKIKEIKIYRNDDQGIYVKAIGNRSIVVSKGFLDLRDIVDLTSMLVEELLVIELSGILFSLLVYTSNVAIVVLGIFGSLILKVLNILALLLGAILGLGIVMNILALIYRFAFFVLLRFNIVIGGFLVLLPNSTSFYMARVIRMQLGFDFELNEDQLKIRKECKNDVFYSLRNNFETVMLANGGIREVSED